MDITTGEGRVTHLAVTHEIRRVHDDSVISAHCSPDCARTAFRGLHLADMMGGDNQPGPLEYVEAHLVDLATGQAVMFTQGLVPLDGIAPVKVESYPHHLFDEPY